MENIRTILHGVDMDSVETANEKAIKEGSLRLMSSGEIQLAKRVFGDRISYNKVWIHHDSYLPFSLQHEHAVMTPHGEIYYRTQLYKDDYSKTSSTEQHTFIHELSHVWQRERGMCVICRGLASWIVSYRYRLDGRLLCEYPMEQQAQIIADNFILSSWGYESFLWPYGNEVVTLDGDLRLSEIESSYKSALRGFPW